MQIRPIFCSITPDIVYSLQFFAFLLIFLDAFKRYLLILKLEYFCVQLRCVFSAVDLFGSKWDQVPNSSVQYFAIYRNKNLPNSKPISNFSQNNPKIAEDAKSIQRWNICQILSHSLANFISTFLSIDHDLNITDLFWFFCVLIKFYEYRESLQFLLLKNCSKRIKIIKKRSEMTYLKNVCLMVAWP